MKNAKIQKHQEPADTIAQSVDRVGEIKAQIAALQAEYDTIKLGLLACGNSSYDGNVYHVQFVEQDRSTLDMKAVREKLSAQFIAAHTKITHVTAMHVSLREPAINIISLKS